MTDNDAAAKLAELESENRRLREQVMELEALVKKQDAVIRNAVQVKPEQGNV